MKIKTGLEDELLSQRNDLINQLSSIKFMGYPEVKELNGKKYIYLRFKKYDRLSSTYAGVYSDELFNNLKNISNTVRELHGKLRTVNTKLAKLGINVGVLDNKVILNMDFIRNNINTIIYGQAIVEGVSATFMETEEIIEKGSSKNVSFDDTLTILNLKNAWKYVLDEDTVRKGINFGVLTTIAGFVNDRQISYPDQIRTTNVLIGGSSFRPPLPQKEEVIKTINQIIESKDASLLDRAISLLCYLCKTQVFGNGNKRTSLIFANFYLMINGGGFIAIPSDMNIQYKTYLVEYYESKSDNVRNFIKDNCYFPL